jgi:hypothetical protein
MHESESQIFKMYGGIASLVSTGLHAQRLKFHHATGQATEKVSTKQRISKMQQISPFKEIVGPVIDARDLMYIDRR